MDLKGVTQTERPPCRKNMGFPTASMLVSLGLIALNHLPLFAPSGIAQEAKKTADVKGYVRDAKSGEALPFANVWLKGTQHGTTTDTRGYFVLVSVPVGTCTLAVSYIGYIPEEIVLKNVPEGLPPLSVELQPTVLQLKGVTVTANAEMLDAARDAGQLTVSPRQLSSLPSLGEIDVFRALQLLPGISGVSDGSSGLYVRGGTPDQNLVLFDGMTIYHVDHFFGFFSAFNADAIKDIQVYKGGFPAQYGGRISSVINLTGKTGDQHRARFGCGANLLSAHAVLEVPLFHQMGTFLLAGRRSYTDFIRSPLYNTIYDFLTGDEGGGAIGGRVRQRGRFANQMMGEFQPDFYFYDLNSKLTLHPSSRDVLAFSLYSGKDDLDKSQDFTGQVFRFRRPGTNTEPVDVNLRTTDFTSWGNFGFSGEWSRQWHDRLSVDVLLAHSKYFSNYDRARNMNALFIPARDSVANVRGFAFASKEDNEVTDLTYRIDVNWHPTPSHQLS